MNKDIEEIWESLTEKAYEDTEFLSCVSARMMCKKMGPDVSNFLNLQTLEDPRGVLSSDESVLVFKSYALFSMILNCLFSGDLGQARFFYTQSKTLDGFPPMKFNELENGYILMYDSVMRTVYGVYH
jgi:hypothetical protein